MCLFFNFFYYTEFEVRTHTHVGCWERPQPSPSSVASPVVPQLWAAARAGSVRLCRVVTAPLDTEHVMTASGLPWGLSGKESACSAGATGNTHSVPGGGRSPGEGQGTALQYCRLEGPLDRGAWRASLHEVTKSQTGLRQLSMMTAYHLLTTRIFLIVSDLFGVFFPPRQVA